MKKPIIRVRFYVGFLIASLLVAFITISSDRSTKKLLESSHGIVSSYHIQREIERLALNISNAQTHTRGYYITHQSAFLDEYQAEKRKLSTNIRRLEELIKSNPQQIAQLRELETVLYVRIGQLDSVVKHVSQKKEGDIFTAENVKIFKSHEHKIQTLFAGMLQTEENILAARMEESNRLSTRTFSIVTAGGTLVLVLMNIAAYVVYRDSTRRQRAENELDKFFEFSLDLHVLADMNGNFTKVNPAFERLLGYSAFELTSKTFFNFIHPDDLESTRIEANKLATGEPVIHFENRYIAKDGKVIWLSWIAAPVGHSIYATARDVSDLHKTQPKVMTDDERPPETNV
ncbi:PAS domain S-box protein [Bdellovibrio reynosensis]|uniref:PAS domain S-box protein n=1 Tax=Bdellovibrio reynosensis TaxID=2835041 RepID=A0ABY4C8F8_9BACT|nr:PAS domain S-box protein [Bdellovibrio reynosensis]UOF01266.1 PAS domain S-box protein [Bdellovibrio reynosensis]